MNGKYLLLIIMVCGGVLTLPLFTIAQEGAPALPEGLGESKKNTSEKGPALPAGLGEPSSDKGGSGPELPAGLGGSESKEPSLPTGLESKTQIEDTTAEQKEEKGALDFQNVLGFPIHGFWEARGGIRTQSDPYIHDDPSIAESRLQLETERLLGPFVFTFMGDTYYDALMDEWEYDLRQLNATASPLDFLDVKVGRQILTWGTGDLFFINDMFPKDWQSFFIGRDVEYLKAPSDALKMSLFTDWFNVNFVYTPQFDPDDYIRGERISYWNGGLGRRAGEDNPVRARTPNDFFTDDEMAFRIYRMIAAYEVAVYGYQGFWKSPGGSHPAGYAIFPELGVYGASVRGTVGPGIGNIEMGYYDSQDDADGDNPMIKNSEMRFLVGYEQEVAENFTVGGQYYVEWMQDYSDYKRVAPSNARLRDEDRHVLTLRLTKLLMQQDLTLSLFTFYSPSDQDTYLRPKVNYKVNDNWTVEAGSNIFIGQNNHTFFGQFEKNTNVYGSVRYSF